ELPRAPVLFEIDVNATTTLPLPVAAAISRPPRVRRDLAIIVHERVPAQAVLDALDAARPVTVASLGLFDVYRSPALGVNKKSLAILMVMQDTERTLTDADVEAAVTALLD